MTAIASSVLRSVLPHEPRPPRDAKGYICLQGSFVPKALHEALGLVGNSKSRAITHQKESIRSGTPEKEAKVNEKRIMLQQSISQYLECLLCTNQNSKCPLPVSPISLSLQPNFTKCDLVFSSHDNATEITQFIRSNSISPQSFLDNFVIPNDCMLLLNDGESNMNISFSRKQFQATQLTALPLPTSPHWPRVSPPKFRRLINPPQSASGSFDVYEKILCDLEDQRQNTRFLFLSGFGEIHVQSWIHGYGSEVEKFRYVLNNFDKSDEGVELWFPSGKIHCYVGMRSNEDALKVMTALQGKRIKFHHLGPQIIDNFDESNINEEVPVTDRLFLDWADITQRSNEKARGADIVKGEPSMSECTSCTADVEIPGLVVIPEFVSSEIEAILQATVTGPTATWYGKQERPSGGKVTRRVQHYGYVFDYETSDVLREKALCPPLPCLPENQRDNLQRYIQSTSESRDGWGLLAGIVEKTRQTSFGDLKFPNLNQLTVNEYEPAQGIGSHVDTHSAFGDGLISISLGSGIVMEFRKVGGTKSTDRKLVYLPPRSVILLGGSARYEWEHMIVGRMTDTVNGCVLRRCRRVSLTLRTAITLSDQPRPLERYETPVFPPRIEEILINDLITPECEKKNVHAVYDAIAEQWHHTRGKRGILWPKATDFIEALPKGSLIADVGCGDGKYFAAGWKAGAFLIGTDISEPLLRTAMGGTDGGKDLRQVAFDQSGASARPSMAVADCVNIPLRNESCDAAICIAVMHHLSTKGRRLQCLRELRRIVKVGGIINIQAWAIDQDKGSKRQFAVSDTFVPFNAQPRYLDRVKTNAEEVKDPATIYAEAYEGAQLNDQNGLIVFQRYCHMYVKGELDALISEVEGLKILESGYESGNYYVVVESI